MKASEHEKMGGECSWDVIGMTGSPCLSSSHSAKHCLFTVKVWGVDTLFVQHAVTENEALLPWRDVDWQLHPPARFVSLPLSACLASPHPSVPATQPSVHQSPWQQFLRVMGGAIGRWGSHNMLRPLLRLPIYHFWRSNAIIAEP